MKRVGQIFRETLVNRVKEGIESSSNVFLLNYTRLSGNQLSELRKELKGFGASVYVSKNSIARIALKSLAHDDLLDKVTGQTAIIWSSTDAAGISKILINFTKNLDKVSIPGALLDNRILNKEEVKKLSDLPSREILLAQLLGTIQAPIVQLLSAMNAKSRELLSILKQYSDKKSE